MRGETLCAELTLAQQKIEDSDKAEEDRLKLAALASIKMPQLGYYFEAGAAGATVYSSKDLSVISGFANPGQYFGPIIDYHSYRLDSATEFIAGLMVEFMDRGKDSSGQLVEYHAYVKLTENAAAICSLCSGPAAKHSIWDAAVFDVIKDTEPTATEPTSLSSASAIGSGYGREVTPGINPLSKATATWPTSRRQPADRGTSQ